MKRLSYKSIIQYVLISGILLAGCRKDDPIPVVIPQANEVNTFVYSTLHDFYLWNGQVDALSAGKYQDKDSLNAFLNKYTDPQALFTSLLYKDVDKFSFLVDNSKTIDNWLSGTSKTLGYELIPARLGTTNNIVAVVLYVYKGSPAEAAGIKRGDIFLTVNDQQLTISNYQTLLYATETSKLGFASVASNTVSLNGRTVNMTAIEMQENPINKDTIFISNNQKIGYLVYNSFNPDFDFELNNVIRKFKDAQIDQMVLDLRYNGGGDVNSCIYLASMLYGTDVSKVFAKTQYNSELQSLLTTEYGANFFNDNFVATIAATAKNAATPINTLNLQKIYFIVSDNTASASEMIINGLRPYMNVKVIGINTYGKYVGSWTIKDVDKNGKEISKWAMQPIVAKFANSVGVSDFVNGLTPDIVAEEDITSLLSFGDPNERLLSYVLADMRGSQITGKTLKSAQMGLKKVAASRDYKPFAHEMYIDYPFKKGQK